ncbi:MAG: hypothetical protein RIC55_32935 [Pirellulaceae bacterium]
MAVTRDDLRDFNRFVDQKLSREGAESLTELARQWEEQRKYEQSVADLQESHEDAAAGRLHSAEDVFSEVRKKLGLPE